MCILVARLVRARRGASNGIRNFKFLPITSIGILSKFSIHITLQKKCF